jgi:hypothetical protein
MASLLLICQLIRPLRITVSEYERLSSTNPEDKLGVSCELHIGKRRGNTNGYGSHYLGRGSPQDQLDRSRLVGRGGRRDERVSRLGPDRRGQPASLGRLSDGMLLRVFRAASPGGAAMLFDQHSELGEAGNTAPPLPPRSWLSLGFATTAAQLNASRSRGESRTRSARVR